MSKIEAAYRQIGGDWEGVTKRLMGEELVERFAKKFLEDDSFDKLKNALEKEDIKEAFMASHTLKGVCQNLGFDNLFKPANDLTEVLRAGSLEGTKELFERVEEQYAITIGALNTCFS